MRSTQRRTQQMSGRDHAAVGHRIEKAFAPIPSRMKTHCEPQVSGSLQRQAEEQSNECGSQQSRPRFAPVFQMNQSEGTREGNRRLPETHPARQSELGISAQQKFFKQADDQEHGSPECGEPCQARAVQYDASECETVEAI